VFFAPRSQETGCACSRLDARHGVAGAEPHSSHSGFRVSPKTADFPKAVRLAKPIQAWADVAGQGESVSECRET
jgi:hypothetical protein